MAVELRPTTAVLVLLAVLVVGAIGSVVTAEVSEEGTETAVNYAPIDGEDRHLWLYTSQGPTFAEPTLALNVIVYGDPGDVQRVLLETGSDNWNETAAEEQDIAPDESVAGPGASEIEWDMADGSARYAYLAGGEQGLWLSEAFQIHDGEYLGSRHHIRAYTAPDGKQNWTAIQAHHEYWDWFMTRHVVTSIDESQAHVEQEFVGVSSSPEITRIPVEGTDRTGFDRWITVVDFRNLEGAALALLPIVLFGGVTRRLSGVASAVGLQYPKEDARALLVATGIVGLMLFVRLVGVGLESSLDVPPKVIAALLYPVLFAGLPVGTYLLARPLDRPRAFAGASVGFLAAILVDYTFLGITHIALNTLVHRGALAVALGLIAAGSSWSERGNSDGGSNVRFGVLLWLVATVLPLLRHTPLPV